MSKHILVAALALFFFMVPTAFAQSDDMALREDIIQSDVSNIIGNNLFYTIYDIVQVEVKGRMVTLSGHVTEPHKKGRYLREINEKFGDSILIQDQIEVLPPSYMDNRIRYLLARSIYNDDRLLRYYVSRWPYPIHIIVKNGHVTLEGTVGTRLDSRLIESKVRGMGGVISLNNNLTIS